MDRLPREARYKRGRPSKIAADPEIKSFIEQRRPAMNYSELADAVLLAFGRPRAPSRSAIGRFLQARPTRQATAYHEAGHAVAAWLSGIKIESISIIPSAEDDGRIVHANPLHGIKIECEGSDRGRLPAERLATVRLAGPIAQRIWNARSWRSRHGAADFEQALNGIAAFSSSPRHCEAWLRAIEVATEDMLRLPEVWAIVAGVAELLMERRSLAGGYAAAAIDRLAGPGVRPARCGRLRWRPIGPQ